MVVVMIVVIMPVVIMLTARVMLMAVPMLVITMAVIVMVASVSMRLFTRMGMSFARIGSAFRIKRPLDLDQPRAQPLHHRLDHVIAPDA
jgi:hypothetical protein